MNKHPQQASVQKSKPTASNRVISPLLPALQLTSNPQPLMIGTSGQLRPQDILHLQRTIGNQAVQRLINNQPSTNPEATTEPIPESEGQEGEIEEEQVELDLDEDGEAELHTLSVDQETGQLMIHSDPQTLEDFLEKYQKRFGPPDQKILAEIKQAADIVHTGRYGTKYVKKGKTKTKPPTVGQRNYVKPQLTFIALKLQSLSKAKYRPLSHKTQHETEVINGETFCKKIVMEPLSVLPRDDNLEGSPPREETKLWRSLTNFAGYKRGHMLNDHLHGPGTNDNLVPISTAFNATMREGVEKAAKKAVNSQNKVVRFEAEAQDWGLFPGAFGFLEEKKLPNKFHFKVQQMKKNLGASGALATDWITNGPILFEDSPIHDIPNDVVKGVVAPTVKTFVPGLYYFPFGSIKSAPPNYHLQGSFNINNLIGSDVLAGLGIDDPKNLKPTSVDETVLTEYKLPPGYDIKLLSPTEIEYEYFGKLVKYTTPDRAFIVYNIADETRLKQEHQVKVDNFKQQQRLLAQQKLSREQQEKLEQLRLENERKMHKEEERRKEEEEKQRAERDKEFRNKLYTQIRNETAGYLDEFGVDFEKARESILYGARKFWLEIPDLIDKNMETLLQPVRDEITKAVAHLKTGSERKEEVMPELFNQFRELLNIYPSKLGASEGQEEFKTNAISTYEYHEEKWEAISLSHWIKIDTTRLWEPLQKELEKAFIKAKEWEGETRNEKVIRALTNKFRQVMKEEYIAELAHHKSKESFDKRARQKFKEYELLWQLESSYKTVSELWAPFEKQLQNDFVIAQQFDRKEMRKLRSLKEERRRDESPRRRDEDEDERRDRRGDRERDEFKTSKRKETPLREKKRTHSDEEKEESEKYFRTNKSNQKNYKKLTSSGTLPTPTINPSVSHTPMPEFHFGLPTNYSSSDMDDTESKDEKKETW